MKELTLPVPRKPYFSALKMMCALFFGAALLSNCNSVEHELKQHVRLKAASIVVRARGTSGAEQIRVTVGGTQVDTRTLTTSYANYAFSTESSGELNVYFTNDGSGRDVQVDYVTVDGSTRQAENQTTNTAVYQNGSCGGSNSEWMHCNGYIGFGQVSAGSSGDNTIVVRARGTNGSESIQLRVNNATINTWTLSTSYQNYTATTTSSGAVTVQFTNDASGRDVQIDYITVNGSIRQAEVQTTNTGVWNGSACGGISSEWLHCNGYIAFGDVGSGSSTLAVSTTSLSVGAAANSTGTFTITSSLSWTVTSSQSWLSVAPASGSNNGTVTVTAQQNTGTASRTATVTVSATGATSQTVTVTQSGSGGGPCTIPAMPSYASLPSNSRLPDPFMFMNGTRMTSRDQWDCRRAEIAALAQEFEYGYKPNTPYSATTGSFSSNRVTVNVSDNGRSISFSCSISYPSGNGPFPAIIGIGGSNLNNSALTSMGVAVITFPNNEIAEQTNSGSRGRGKFYDMYGSSHSAGAIMAWSWGVSRLIDALEKTPSARIDASRLGVTGCSRNGKGALAAGAFEERIKLTIPQESGSGGAASWRVSDWQKSQGQNVQTLSQIVGENCWFRANFNQFSSTANKLPFDHHMIAALCAPRALLIIENTSMEWLGNVSTWATGNVAHMVWQGLGVPDRMGFSQVGHSDHCGFPSSQQPELSAYVQKFLIGTGSGNTTIMRTDGNLTFDRARWVDWTVPTLQ